MAELILSRRTPEFSGPALHYHRKKTPDCSVSAKVPPLRLASLDLLPVTPDVFGLSPISSPSPPQIERLRVITDGKTLSSPGRLTNGTRGGSGAKRSRMGG